MSQQEVSKFVNVEWRSVSSLLWVISFYVGRFWIVIFSWPLSTFLHILLQENKWLNLMGQFGSRNCSCLSPPFILLGKWAGYKDHAFAFLHPCCGWMELGGGGVYSWVGMPIWFWMSILGSPLAHTFNPHFSVFLSHRNFSLLLEACIPIWETNSKWIGIKHSHTLEIRKIFKPTRKREALVYESVPTIIVSPKGRQVIPNPVSYVS